jgi:hypothetical protein
MPTYNSSSVHIAINRTFRRLSNKHSATTFGSCHHLILHHTRLFLTCYMSTPRDAPSNPPAADHPSSIDTACQNGLRGHIHLATLDPPPITKL